MCSSCWVPVRVARSGREALDCLELRGSRRPAGHRHARDERLRSRPRHPQPAVRQATDAGGPDRLGPGRRPRRAREAGFDHHLVKPAEIEALQAKNSTVPWVGVRNYQARNFMRDGMKVGDGVLFYHSSCAEPGIIGIARVASTAYPDPTQFDATSPYYDAKSQPEEPRWLLVDVQVVKKVPNITLPELRARPELEDLMILRKGNRLSITPVEAKHWKAIVGR
jgi:predicted RNA-binding protein with PUA-like domain